MSNTCYKCKTPLEPIGINQRNLARNYICLNEECLAFNLVQVFNPDNSFKNLSSYQILDLEEENTYTLENTKNGEVVKGNFLPIFEKTSVSMEEFADLMQLNYLYFIDEQINQSLDFKNEDDFIYWSNIKKSLLQNKSTV